jgi:hypothetical protein
VRTAEEAGCELRPSPLAEPEGPVSWLLPAPRKAAAVSNFNCRKRPNRQIEYTESCHKLFVQSARKYASLVTSKVVLSMAIIQGTHTSPPQLAAPSACRRTSTAMGVRSPLSAAQVASGLRIEPSQPRDAHSRHTNARPRRSNVVAAARNSQCHVSEVSQRRVSRTTAVGRSGSCAARRGTGLDPGPCSPCTAATSHAVDARICSELGSHTKPGLHTRRLPQRAVSSP